MADTEITLGTVVNLELQQLVTTNLEKGIAAQLKEAKMPTKYIKQDIGLDVTGSLDKGKVDATLQRLLKKVDAGIEQASESATRTTALKLGRGKSLKEFNTSLEQLVTLRDAILTVRSGLQQNLEGMDLGRAVTILNKLKKGGAASLSAVDLAGSADALDQLASVMGIISKQTNAIVSKASRLNAMVKTGISGEDDDGNKIAAYAKAVPVVMDKMATFARTSAGVVREATKAQITLQESSLSLKQAQATAEEVKLKARAHVLPIDQQRALSQSMSDADLQIARTSVQSRIKQLSQLETNTLSRQEKTELESLLRAGTFYKQEQQSRNRVSSLYQTEGSAAAEAAARAAQDKRDADRRALTLRTAAAMEQQLSSANLGTMALNELQALKRRTDSQVGRLHTLQEGVADPTKDPAVNNLHKSLLASSSALNDHIKAIQRSTATLEQEAKQRASAVGVAKAAIAGLTGADFAAMTPVELAEARSRASGAGRGLAQVQRFDPDGTQDPEVSALRQQTRKLVTEIEAQQRENKKSDRDADAQRRQDEARLKVLSNADQTISRTTATPLDSLNATDLKHVKKLLTTEMGSIEQQQRGKADIKADTEMYRRFEKVRDTLEEIAKIEEDRATKSKEAEKQKREAEKQAKAHESEKERRTRLMDEELAKVGGYENYAQLPAEFHRRLPKHLEGMRGKLESEIQRITESGGDASAQRAELSKLSGVIDEIGASSNRTGNAIQKLGGLFQNFFRYALGYGALYQLMGAIGGLITGVVDLSAKMTEIRAVAGLTDRELATVGKSIEGTASRFAFSVAQISDAALTLAQAGVDMKDIGNVLNSVASFATATGSSMQQAADLITSMRDVYENIDSQTMSGLLAQAVNVSKLTGGDLQTIIGLSAGTAKAFNLTAEQYLAAASTLRNAGLRASTVATGMRQAMLELFNPDKKLLDVLERRYAEIGEGQARADISAKFFGFSQGENGLANILNELERLGMQGSAKHQFEGGFDIRSRNAIEALMRNRDQLAAFEAQLGAGDSLTISAAENLQNVTAALQQVRNEAQLLANQLTNDLLPGLVDVLHGFGDFLAGIRNFDVELKAEGGKGLLNSSATNALFAGIVGAVATKGGFMARAGGALGLAAATGAVTPAITGAASAMGAGPRAAESIGGVVGAIVPAVITWLSLRGGGGLSRILSTALTGVGAGGQVVGLLSRFLPLLGPIGIALSAISAGFSLYGAVKGASTEERFEGSMARARRDTEEYGTNYAVSQAYSGDAAGPRRVFDKIEERVKSFDATMVEVFGAKEEDIAYADDLLQQVFKEGLDATGGARKALVAKLNAVSGRKLSDEDVNALARDASELEAQSKAIVDAIVNEQQRIRELGDRATEQDKARARAFDSSIRSAYAYVLADPASASVGSRMQMLKDYYDAVKKATGDVTAEAAKKASESLDEAINNLKKLMAEGADEDTLANAMDSVVLALRGARKDVVAELRKLAVEAEKERAKLQARPIRAIDIDQRETELLPTTRGMKQAERRALALQQLTDERNAEADALVNQSMSRLVREGNARKQQEADAISARDAAIKNAEDAQTRLAKLGGKAVEGLAEALVAVRAGGVRKEDDTQETVLEKDKIETLKSKVVAAGNDIVKLERGIAFAEAKKNTDEEIALRNAAETAQAKITQATKDKTISGMENVLGLSNAGLDPTSSSYYNDVSAKLANNKTMYDEYAKLEGQRIKAQLTKEKAALAKLEKEGYAGSTEGDKAKEYAAKKLEISNIEKAQRQLQATTDEQKRMLADKLADAQAKKNIENVEHLLKMSKADVERTAALGSLTADGLDAVIAQEKATLADLYKFYEAQLLAVADFRTADGKDAAGNAKFRLNELGQAELKKKIEQNPAQYGDRAGAELLVKSGQASYDKAARDAEMYNNFDRQRQQAALGHESLADTRRSLTMRQEARSEELVGLQGGIFSATKRLDDAMDRGIDAEITKARGHLDVLLKQQDAVVKDLNALTVQSQEINGAINEEFTQMLEMLSPDAFERRAALGTEALSQGFGSALERTINGIGDALVNATRKGKDFKTEMKNLAVEVGDALAKMFLQEGVNQLFSLMMQGGKALFGGGGASTPSGSSGNYNFDMSGFKLNNKGWADISVGHFAQGGIIRGSPGTDTIPGVVVNADGKPTRRIMVSAGESILTTQATALLGRRNIEFLNRGEVPLSERTAKGSTNIVTANNVGGDMNFNIPVSIESEQGDMGAGNEATLQQAIRSSILKTIEEQKRPGGSLYRR